MTPDPESPKESLLGDFLGVDTQTTSGGNGDYDGITGTPTRLLLTLGGLPAGSYRWTSFHHDFDFLRTAFIVEVSTDGGTTFLETGRYRMTHSKTSSTPAGVTGFAWVRMVRSGAGGFALVVVLSFLGGFNVNSTSVHAWKAMLASTRSGSDHTPFPRFLNAPDGEWSEGGTSGHALDEKAWSGTRSLTDKEIGALAEAIVVAQKKDP